MKKQFKRFRVRTVSAVCVLAFAANTWAVEPFTVRDIRVEGLQRVEPGTVFASLPFRVGDQYNDDKGSAAIRALFALGLFKDVRLETQGDLLIVIVEERPTVADVSPRAVPSTRRWPTAPSRSSSASTSTAASTGRRW